MRVKCLKFALIGVYRLSLSFIVLSPTVVMGVDNSCKPFATFAFMEITDLKLKIRKSKDALYQERYQYYIGILLWNNIF